MALDGIWKIYRLPFPCSQTSCHPIVDILDFSNIGSRNFFLI